MTILLSFSYDPRKDIIRFSVTPEIDAELAKPHQRIAARAVFEALVKAMPRGGPLLSRRKVIPCMRYPAGADGTRWAPVLSTAQSLKPAVPAVVRRKRCNEAYIKRQLVAGLGVE